MSKSTKRILTVILAVFLLAAFAGCSKSSSDTGAVSQTGSQTGSKTDTQTESTTKTDTEQAAKESKEPVKLQAVGLWWSDENFENYKADPVNKYHVLIRTREEVEKQYPEYQVSFEDWGWAEQLDQKQRVTLLSGNAPNIVHGESFMQQYAEMDILEPLPQDIVEKANPNFLLKNKKGEAVAMGCSGSIFMLFYNKDLVAQAGFDPNEPIKTWDDWKKISDAITAKGGGKIFGGGIPSHPHVGGAFRVAPFLRQLGSDFGGGSKVTLNTPEMIKVLTFVREMDRNIPKGIGNNPDEGPLYKMFDTDKTLGFVVNGTWQATNLEQNPQLGYCPLPLPEGGKDGNCLVGFDYYGVPKLADNKEEAFNIIRMMVDKEINKEFVKYCRTGAPNKEIYDDPELRQDDFVATLLDILKAGTYTGLPTFDKNDAQVWEVINNKMIARTTMTNDPIEKIVEDAQAECDNLLK